MTAPDAREATIREAWASLAASLIAVSPHLSTPYPDDDRWTPWTRFVEKEVDDMEESLQALTSLAADARKAALAEAVVEAAEAHIESRRSRGPTRWPDLLRIVAAYRDAFPAAESPLTDEDYKRAVNDMPEKLP